MTMGSILLAVTLGTPLAVLAICLLSDWGRILLPFAPVPALATALLAPDGSILKLPDMLLGLTLTLDKPGALLLGTAALLWIAAALYAGADRQTRGRGFSIWWLTTLTGSLGVFIAADMVGFYLFFTLVSLAAYWLVVEDGMPSSRRAGAVYVSFALLSEAFLLLALVLLAAAAPDNSLLIRDVVAALSTSPTRDAVLALLILGFGTKIALVPMHVWMPLTYSAAPIPVAAVLSGAAVKAGVIGLIRFLPFDTALPGWGEALVVLGLCSAFYGVAIGVTQRNPRTVLAYSSVSQMGVIATVLGMGLAAGDKSVPILVTFYALHHILAKGGLFLALGVASQSSARGLWLVMLPAAIIALGLGGLPLTGGALAKSAVKAPLGDGMVGALAMLSAAASTLLMLHFLRCLRAGIGDSDARAPAGLLMPWLAIACAAIILPWLLYSSVTNISWLDTFSPKAIWDLLWPVFVGGLSAVALQLWRGRLPAIPPGDILAADKAIANAAGKLGALMERVDWRLRQWTMAGILFLVLSTILAGAMFAGR